MAPGGQGWRANTFQAPQDEDEVAWRRLECARHLDADPLQLEALDRRHRELRDVWLSGRRRRAHAGQDLGDASG